MNNFPFIFCSWQFAFYILFSESITLGAEVVPVDSPLFQGELIGANADWQLTFLTNGKTFELPAADLVRWGHCPEQGRAGGLVTKDGGWIVAYVVSADGDKLTAENDLLGTFIVPFNSLAAVVFHNFPFSSRDGPGTRTYPSKNPLSAEKLPTKTLLQNGDILTGPILGIENASVKLNTDIGTVEIPTKRVTAIILHTKQVVTNENNIRVWIGLNDGSRLLASHLMIDGDSASFNALGRQLKTSAKNIVFLQPLGGRAIYLSDLQPTEYRQTSFLTTPTDDPNKLNLSWPWHADRSVIGRMLRANGHNYLKGIGTHSAARLVYSLHSLGEGQGGRARRFQALAAIDDSAKGGSAQFRVLVDGREAYTSPTIRGGDKPVPVEVDLTGAKQLELIVDYADHADVLDRADWLDARIVR